jgi:hypothetical protein
LAQQSRVVLFHPSLIGRKMVIRRRVLSIIRQTYVDIALGTIVRDATREGCWVWKSHMRSALP